MAGSKKRPALDDVAQPDGNLPSPSLSAPTAATPKRLRLTTTQPTGTPSHLDITKTLAKTPLTPQTPSKKPSRKQQLATDPINVSIYTLRREGRAWDDIATRTNTACGLSEGDELTGAACYSRFSRNGPLVARAKGHEFRKEAYIHMKGPVAEIGGIGKDAEFEEGGAKEEKVVLKAVETVRDAFWASVVEVINEGLQEGKEMSEERVKAIYDRVGEGGD